MSERMSTIRKHRRESEILSDKKISMNEKIIELRESNRKLYTYKHLAEIFNISTWFVGNAIKKSKLEQSKDTPWNMSGWNPITNTKMI